VSALLHIASIALLVIFASYQPQTWLLYVGCTLFTLILASEHYIVTPTKQRNIGIAFGTFNALASVSLATFLILNLVVCG
jgi:4-hydroxybenzoate polyprenyltransferase